MNSLYKILIFIFLLGTNTSVAQEVALDIEIPAYHDRDDGNLSFSTGNLFPDFTETDISGVSHNLYSYLDDGYAVVLNFFTYYCQPCEHAGPSLDHFYQNYDFDYELVKVIGFESTSHNQQSINEISISSVVENWDINYPVINSDDLLDQYETYVEVFPTYIVICPDRTYHLEEGYGSGATLPFITQSAFECLGTDVDNDLDVLSIESQRCESSMTLNVQFQNTGTNNITNFDYIVLLNNSPIDTVSYTCSLSEGDILITSSTYDNIPAGNIDVSIEANLNYQEDNLYNNALEVELAPTNMIYDSLINLTVFGDNFPEETAWKLSELNGEIIAQGGFDDDYTVVGLSNSNSSQDISLTPNTCYLFEIFDTYGDGICCGQNQGYGYFSIQGLNTGEMILYGGEFSYLEQFTFHVSIESVIGLEEVDIKNKIITSEVYYDLVGRRVENPVKGRLLLRLLTFDDGSSHIEKIILE